MAKRKNIVFGVIFMAVTVFFASCSDDVFVNHANDDNNTIVSPDITGGSTIFENAAIGSVVRMDDATFYVIKNTYLQNQNSSRAAISESTDDVSDSIDDEDAKRFVKKFAGAGYIDTYLNQEANITEYILLYNIDDVKTVKKRLLPRTVQI